ncbi:MAG: FHA domain-containing protein, partial [Deltaproteobacteria bacterium]|nr:FHA domain-containing protein [Deltaproteobacteria bacterium]
MYALVPMTHEGDVSPIFAGADSQGVLGRAPDSKWSIEHRSLSRRHAELSFVAGQLLVQDLGSSNGTFINGDQIRDISVLRTGDRLRMGEVEYRVMGGGGEAEVTRATISVLDGDRSVDLRTIMQSMGGRADQASAEERLRLLLRVSE